MALSQFDIIKSLGESIEWFEKELSWGMMWIYDFRPRL